MNENNTGFAEFAEAFGIDPGNQTEVSESNEAAESTTETTESEEVTQGAQEEATGEENAEGAESAGAEENPAEASQEPEKPISEQKFELKVDGKTKEVGFDELKELAQKGGAFDRVKGQLTEARQSIQNLQTELSKSKEISDLVNRIAEDVKSTPAELLKRVRINLRMNNGETEKEAMANIEAADARRQVEEMKAQQTPAKESNQDRAAREVAEFREEYPDVDLSTELLEALTPDVQSGMPLTKAYQKYDAAKKEADAQKLRDEIAELKQKLEAEKQNKKNRANSPGSQRDSGGSRGGSDFNDFMSAFNAAFE